MAQIEKKDKKNYLAGLLKATGVFTLLSIVLPSTASIESGVWSLLWYVGIFWGGDVYGEEFIGFINDPDYIQIGVITTVLLVISLILIFISFRNIKNENHYKLTTLMSSVGSILVIISPIIYYFYLTAEIPTFFWGHLPLLGTFLSVMAGIFGIVSTIILAFTKLRLESSKK